MIDGGTQKPTPLQYNLPSGGNPTPMDQAKLRPYWKLPPWPTPSPLSSTSLRPHSQLIMHFNSRLRFCFSGSQPNMGVGGGEEGGTMTIQCKGVFMWASLQSPKSYPGTKFCHFHLHRQSVSRPRGDLSLQNASHILPSPPNLHVQRPSLPGAHSAAFFCIKFPTPWP